MQALQHILNAMQILCARDAVVAVLAPHGSAPGYGSNMKKAAAEAAGAGGAGSTTVTPAGTLTTMEAAAEVRGNTMNAEIGIGRAGLPFERGSVNFTASASFLRHSRNSANKPEVGLDFCNSQDGGLDWSGLNFYSFSQ